MSLHSLRTIPMVQLLLHVRKEKTSRVRIHPLTHNLPSLCLHSAHPAHKGDQLPDLGPAAGCVSGRNSKAVFRDCSPLISTSQGSAMAPLEGVASDPAWRHDPTIWYGCSSINARSQLQLSGDKE